MLLRTCKVIPRSLQTFLESVHWTLVPACQDIITQCSALLQMRLQIDVIKVLEEPRRGESWHGSVLVASVY